MTVDSVSQLTDAKFSMYDHCQVVINDQPLKLLEEAVVGVNVDNCDHPCMAHPCVNGGRCIAIREKYQCSCPLGFENTNCEDSE